VLRSAALLFAAVGVVDLVSGRGVVVGVELEVWSEDGSDVELDGLSCRKTRVMIIITTIPNTPYMKSWYKREKKRKKRKRRYCGAGG